jgi:hypothetical protein
MATYTMTDAAYFSAGMLSGANAVAGYIGGPNAAHVWADSDWQATGTVPKLPIWVPAASASDAQARSEVIQILDVCLHYEIPRPQTIAFDLETSEADFGYMTAMADFLKFFGYGCMAYGSLDSITTAVSPYLWKWSASWTGSPHLDSGEAIVATQWANNSEFDTSEITQELMNTLVWKKY